MKGRPRTVVISQPMYFPWAGMLEQLRVADVWIHYDDVQFSKGSFSNRVQVKTPAGLRWMTVPLENLHLGQTIGQVRTREAEGWREKHLALLAHSYQGTPFLDDMLALAREVVSLETDSLAELSIASVTTLARYFGIGPADLSVRSSQLPVGGSSSQRVLDLVRHVGATRYVTGHGARNYLDHEAFERAGITVEYLDYAKSPYPQVHGGFTASVTALDLVAHCGREGVRHLPGATLPWRAMMLAAAG